MACPTGKRMLPQRGYTIFTETPKFQVMLPPKRIYDNNSGKKEYPMKVSYIIHSVQIKIIS